MTQTWQPAETALEQLDRWDQGDSIWSLEMGGMGPGYEQCIQILAIEIVRDEVGKLFPVKPPPADGWADATVARVNPKLHFSGAQVGAAKSLAYNWLTIGPAALLKKAPVDRHIQVSKTFPHL